jgi:hypothetical protein
MRLVPDGHKEEPMEHTHEYDCIVCGAHFDSTKDLSEHNQREHIRKATGMERPRDPNARPEEHERDGPIER